MPGKRRLVLLGLLAASCSAFGEPVESLVLRVVDGDTLVVLDAAQRPRNIRILGIDAPEITQAFGQQAQTGLSARVAGQAVAIDCWRGAASDVCRVYVGGQDVGLQMLGAGMAWWNVQDAGRMTQEERAAYEQAEFNAKIRRLGLWNSKNPTPPWQWRRRTADQ